MPSNEACAAKATVCKTQKKYWFQSSSGPGAGALVVPLPYRAYFGKLALLFSFTLLQ